MAGHIDRHVRQERGRHGQGDGAPPTEDPQAWSQHTCPAMGGRSDGCTQALLDARLDGCQQVRGSRSIRRPHASGQGLEIRGEGRLFRMSAQVFDDGRMALRRQFTVDVVLQLCVEPLFCNHQQLPLRRVGSGFRFGGEPPTHLLKGLEGR